MGGTGESQNPGVGVRWVHQRPALEAQRPKMLKPPVERDEPCCGGRVRRVSESDTAVPAIKLDRGVENGETRSGSGRRQCSRDPTVRCPPRRGSFMSEDCVRRWAIQGEALNVQARIRLADGSALEVVRSLKVDVGMTGKVTTNGGRPNCGACRPAVGVEDLSKGIPPLDGERPRRRGGSRRARKAPWSSHRPASSRARTDETSKTQTVQPNSSIMAKIAEGEAVAAVDLQAIGRGATVQDMGPWVESSPRFARSGSPSMSAVGDTREDREEESPEAEAVWPEDLEPELKEFLEAAEAGVATIIGLDGAATTIPALKRCRRLRRKASAQV
ncbi:hypothetical protein ACLKA6_013875 [Drosophila palustris]